MTDIHKLGIDLGGTNIRVGLLTNNKLEKTIATQVPKTNDSEFILNTILSSIEKAYQPGIQSIGMGVPGLVDPKNLIIHNIVNIPAFSEVEMGKIIQDKYQLPVAINNDANCFALGEHKYGKGKGSKNMVGLAIGTGIGAGIISNSKLLSDANCGSGEYGEIPYLDSNIEAYCSGKFFREKYNSTGEEIFTKAKRNDTNALNAFKEFGYHLSQVIKIICLTVDPELIVIGGSVAKSKEFYHNYMIEGLKDFIFKSSITKLRIEYSDLDNAAILGAAELHN